MGVRISIILTLKLANLMLAAECNTSYLPNYYISKHYLVDGLTESPSSLRQYYPGVPLEIEARTHAYLDAPLLEFFSTCKTFAWYEGIIH